MSEPVTITEPEAAQAFASAKPRSILMSLMREPRSLKGLAEDLGLSMSLLHYHLARLRRLGLVRVVRTDARAGRPITIYGPAAPSFVVPADLVDSARAGGLRAELFAALERDRTRRPSTAMVYDLGEDRKPRMRRIGDGAPSPVSGEWWSRLQLSDRDASALVAELREIVGRYSLRTTPGGRSFLLLLAMAQG